MTTEEHAPPGPFVLFAVEPTEVTWIGLNQAGDALVIDTWKLGRGLAHHER